MRDAGIDIVQFSFRHTELAEQQALRRRGADLGEHGLDYPCGHVHVPHPSRSWCWGNTRVHRLRQPPNRRILLEHDVRAQGTFELRRQRTEDPYLNRRDWTL